MGLQEIRSIRYSNSGKYIACSFLFIQLWDQNSKITSDLIVNDAESLKICFSKCDKYLASACSDGCIRIWNIENAEITYIIMAHAEVYQNPFFGLSMDMFDRVHDLITALEYSNCGRYLLSAGNDGYVKIIDLVTQNSFYEIKAHMQKVLSASFSIDGNWIISTGGGGIRVWDFKQILAKKKHILKIEKSECEKLIMVSEDRHE
ncbi:unnamed protein product [Blepharisma stoltei]|uniref:Uncharacterized protein n=1 Tax=Blepharisma stoltei TaxID=1481888 RepID=A0AAU9J573_9CILI|nr:unnamed protein product [Blepharisma stoltei]